MVVPFTPHLCVPDHFKLDVVPYGHGQTVVVHHLKLHTGNTQTREAD